LRQERVAILDQVLKENHIPAGMEMFAAGDENSWEVIRRTIDICDIYVVLVGARYGSFQDQSGKKVSFTEREFRYAQEKGKPIIAFLLGQDEAEFNGYRAAIEAKESDEKKVYIELMKFRDSVREAGDNEERLVGFFRKEKEETTISPIDNPCIQELKSAFTTSLNNLINIQSQRLSGWIRASANLISVGRVHDDPFIRPILNRLTRFSDLRDRNVFNSDLKSVMAERFWV
jgi:hypothetical protein